MLKHLKVLFLILFRLLYFLVLILQLQDISFAQLLIFVSIYLIFQQFFIYLLLAIFIVSLERGNLELQVVILPLHIQDLFLQNVIVLYDILGEEIWPIVVNQFVKLWNELLNLGHSLKLCEDFFVVFRKMIVLKSLILDILLEILKQLLVADDLIAQDLILNDQRLYLTVDLMNRALQFLFS